MYKTKVGEDIVSKTIIVFVPLGKGSPVTEKTLVAYMEHSNRS